MKPALLCSAIFFAVGGPLPAVLPLLMLARIHVARSPDRLLDAAYVAAFCAMGYAAG